MVESCDATSDNEIIFDFMMHCHLLKKYNQIPKMDSKVEPIFSSNPLYMDLVMDYVKKLSHNKYEFNIHQTWYQILLGKRGYKTL